MSQQARESRAETGAGRAKEPVQTLTGKEGTPTTIVRAENASFPPFAFAFASAAASGEGRAEKRKADGNSSADRDDGLGRPAPKKTGGRQKRRERSPSEEKLTAAVERFLAGEDQAFDEAAALAGRMAYHLALRAVHDSELAEEIAQEALIRLYSRAREISDAGAFKSWFYRVVLNLVNDHYRRHARQEQLCSSLEELRHLEAKSRTSPLPGIEREELQQALNAALAKLDENQRKIFILKEIEGLSHAEIAEMLGVPEGTVWSRLSYARRKLRKFLEEDGFVP